MLFESHVIDSVCKFLESNQFTIKQRLTETQKGDDIIAEQGSINPNNSIRFKIESPKWL